MHKSKESIVKNILATSTNVYGKIEVRPIKATAFAPSNIALGKYWGKRDEILNLPTTPSLSISLGNLGATTSISLKDNVEQSDQKDTVIVNKQLISEDSEFYQRLISFLDLFGRNHNPNYNTRYQIETETNIPIGAGVASSACGFAAAVRALDQLYAWHLEDKALSILARLGSGSACRSLWQGFVEWQAGIAEDGMDSYAGQLPVQWPELRIGLLLINPKAKKISSRAAMKQTRLTSPFYKVWPDKHQADMLLLKQAILEQDFDLLGTTTESNALAMHALMQTATPPIFYSESGSFAAQEKIWNLRQQGLKIYFTQDAGPNLKLLFLEKEQQEVHKHFPDLKIVAPFDYVSTNNVSTNNVSTNIKEPSKHVG